MPHPIFVGFLLVPTDQSIDDSRDGADAIWAESEEKLQQAIEAGWALPRIRPRSPGPDTEDLALVLRCVARGWLPGWRLLRQAWPHLLESERLLDAALTECRHEVIEDILQATGRDPDQAFSDTGQRPAWALFQPISREVGEPVPEEDIIKSALVLRAHDGDLAIPYPGAFSEGDSAQGGHTVWTQAIMAGRWRVVSALAPQTWDEAQLHPRLKDALEHWFTIAWVGGSALRPEPNLRAREAWLDWLAPFACQWMDLSEVLLEPHGWTPLLAMDLPSRQKVWDRLAQPEELGWSGLHKIAVGASQSRDLALTLLGHAHSESLNPSALERGWISGNDENVRPCDLWAMSLGAPSPRSGRQDKSHR
jgi:hypothetical protein